MKNFTLEEIDFLENLYNQISSYDPSVMILDREGYTKDPNYHHSYSIYGLGYKGNILIMGIKHINTRNIWTMERIWYF